MTLVCQELCQALSQVRLEPHIFTLKPVDELRVLPLEVGQMTEVHKEGLLFLELEVFRGATVVAHVLVVCGVHLGHHLHLRVIFSQCVAKTNEVGVR